jgi:hypothetical protein
MYSNSSVAVDKGLGFDFSGLTDLVKSAATTGLGIYQNQMQLKQTKELAKLSQQMGYNVPVVRLPQTQMYAPQPTFNTPMQFMPTQRTGMDTTTMLVIGGVAIGGIMLLKFLTR